MQVKLPLTQQFNDNLPVATRGHSRIHDALTSIATSPAFSDKDLDCTV
jgi:hypothetical protein